ncbi:hypothetical protein CCH79_00020773, partial [Gambusia affinis]
MEEFSRCVTEAGGWLRSCCCCQEEEEEDEGPEEEEEHPRSCTNWTSIPPSVVPVEHEAPGPSGPQPYWFHTLQVRRLRIPRGRSNSDPLRAATAQEVFTWKAGLEFGAAQSYLSLEKLGEGAFASVYKGISRSDGPYMMTSQIVDMHLRRQFQTSMISKLEKIMEVSLRLVFLFRINGQLVALKVIRMKTDEGIPFTAIREASLLKHLKHANIVLLHDIIHTRETLTFVFEYVQTDLAQYMTQHPGGLHSHNVRIFMFQLLRALSYIHSRRILHRDLKPHNLLISYLGELKVADFGLCCAFNPERLHGAGLARSKSIPAQNFSSEVVTLCYRPPDVLMGSIHYSTALDMWGAGCIFIEMLQGAPAFAGGSDELEQLQNIWTVLGVPSEDSWPGVSLLPNYTPGELTCPRSHAEERFIHCRPKLFRDVWKRSPLKQGWAVLVLEVRSPGGPEVLVLEVR